MRRDVEHPDAYLALGIAHRDLRKIDNAVHFFQAAQRLSPNSYEAFYEEGRVESDRNRHARAIRALERAVALSDQIPQMSIKLDALRRLGRAYKEAGNRGAARETLQRFLDLAPRSEPARAEVERMMRSL